ncbi:helix-turn-helix transcriptional regulator [Marininema halotolerans]|uniref:Transcriptional regulator, contains XRE-family HTH domain n=1 Tax=Marininema halotolerans TaxID=1155944 RepID=A0A1I6U3Y9_9BACL|nr:helix-turn-helix transcriptional regulator [Marininema halotolerans]SFS96156.1 Transcriptional regulator, contains XRE-family HTH domain [Marininema halotolerans]
MELSKMRNIGEAIRRVRKSKGLRLEDLADDNISPATISNIERGVSHVNNAKIDYIVEKLGLSMGELPSVLMEQEEELSELRFSLSSVELLVDLGKSREALQQLDQLHFEDSHAYAALFHVLKGRAFLSQKNWKRAERSYSTAISLCGQNSNEENLEATSYLDLSLCSYEQNEIERALEFTDSGLDTFVEGNGRDYVKYALIRNKVVFLIRLGRNIEGLKVIQDVWDQIDHMEDTDTVLAFYETRADLLRKMGLYDEAIQFASKGLELARVNKNYQFIFDILITMGSLYSSQKQFKKAEDCFNTGLASKGLLTNEKVLTDAYIGLGKLYVKLGKTDEAHQLFKQAIANAENYDDAPNLTYALRVMGDFLKLGGNKLEAVTYYEKAIKITQKFHYQKAESQLHIRISQCYQDSNQKEFEKSLLNMYKAQVNLRGGDNEIFEED